MLVCVASDLSVSASDLSVSDRQMDEGNNRGDMPAAADQSRSLPEIVRILGVILCRVMKVVKA